MKKILIYTGFVLIVLLMSWLFFGSPKVGKYIKIGKEIQAVIQNNFNDSIETLNLKIAVETYKNKYDSILSQNKAITATIERNKANYQAKIKQLSGYTQTQLDSIYQLYAKDTTEAIENFYSLDECLFENDLLYMEISNINKLNTDCKLLVDKLSEEVQTDGKEMINLRNENANLLTDLEIAKQKMKRRTVQRNITGVAAIGLIILLTVK